MELWRYHFFVRTVLLILVVAAGCSTASTAPPLGDCPNCTFRPGHLVVASDAGADAANPDSGSPADSGADTGTPDTGPPPDGAPE